MRITFYLLATLFFVSPTLALAQYDFDDFLQAIESGKAKAGPPSGIAPRVAQRDDALLPNPSDSTMFNIEVPSIKDSREVPSTSILPSPTTGLKNSDGEALIPESLSPATGGPSNAGKPITQTTPMPLSMLEDSDVGSAVVGSSVAEATMSTNQTPASSAYAATADQVDFHSLFSQPQASGNYNSTAPMGSNCASCTHAHTKQASCAVMPYRQPLLPAPSSLRGYFNASPCLAHVWDDYACEAAAACAKFQLNHGHCGCLPGEQIYESCGSGCFGCENKDCD